MSLLSKVSLPPRGYGDIKRTISENGKLGGYFVSPGNGELSVSPRFSKESIKAFFGGKEAQKKQEEALENGALELAETIDLQYGKGVGKRVLQRIGKLEAGGTHLKEPVATSDLPLISREIERENTEHIQHLIKTFQNTLGITLSEKEQESIYLQTLSFSYTLPANALFAEREKSLQDNIIQNLLLAEAQTITEHTPIEKKLNCLGNIVFYAATAQPAQAFLKDRTPYTKALEQVVFPILEKSLAAILTPLLEKLKGVESFIVTEPDCHYLAPEEQKQHLARAQIAINEMMQAFVGASDGKEVLEKASALPKEVKQLLSCVSVNVEKACLVRGDTAEDTRSKVKTALFHTLLHEGASKILSKNWPNAASHNAIFLVNCTFDGRLPENHGYTMQIKPEVEKWRNAAQNFTNACLEMLS